MEPLPFVAWRAGVGSVVLLVVVASLHRRRGAGWASLAVPSGQRAPLAVAASMALLLNLSIFGAFQRIPVALALIGFYLYPALVAGVAVALGRERASGPVILALVLAMGGMVAVVAGGLGAEGDAGIDPVGVGLALTAALAQTVFVTVSRDGYRSVPAEQATGVILAGTVVGCGLIALAGGTAGALGEPLRRADLVPIVLAAGAAGAAIPSLLFLTSIRLVGGTRAGIVMLLEPVIGVGLAAVLLGETLRPVQVAGAAAVLVAAVLLQRTTSRAGEGRDAGARATRRARIPVAAHEAPPIEEQAGPTGTIATRTEAGTGAAGQPAPHDGGRPAPPTG